MTDSDDSDEDWPKTVVARLEKMTDAAIERVYNKYSRIKHTQDSSDLKASDKKQDCISERQRVLLEGALVMSRSEIKMLDTAIVAKCRQLDILERHIETENYGYEEFVKLFEEKAAKTRPFLEQETKSKQVEDAVIERLSNTVSTLKREGDDAAHVNETCVRSRDVLDRMLPQNPQNIELGTSEAHVPPEENKQCEGSPESGDKADGSSEKDDQDKKDDQVEESPDTKDQGLNPVDKDNSPEDQGKDQTGNEAEDKDLPDKVDEEKSVSEKDDVGTDAAEKDDVGTDAAEKDDVGTDAAEKDDVGTDAAEKDDVGTDAAEKDDVGTDAARKDDVGTNAGTGTEKDDVGTDAGTGADKDDVGTDAAEKDDVGTYAGTGAEKDDVGTDAAEKDDVGTDAGTGAEKDDVGTNAAEKDDVGTDAGTGDEKDDVGTNAAEKDDVGTDAGTGDEKDDVGTNAAEKDDVGTNAAEKDDVGTDAGTEAEKDDVGTDAGTEAEKDDVGTDAAEKDDQEEQDSTSSAADCNTLLTNPQLETDTVYERLLPYMSNSQKLRGLLKELNEQNLSLIKGWIDEERDELVQSLSPEDSHMLKSKVMEYINSFESFRNDSTLSDSDKEMTPQEQDAVLEALGQNVADVYPSCVGSQGETDSVLEKLSVMEKHMLLLVQQLEDKRRLYEEEMQREKEKQQREKAKKNLHRSLSAPPKKLGKKPMIKFKRATPKVAPIPEMSAEDKPI